MLMSGQVFWSLAKTNRIAYANERDIVNKDSPIDSLTLINQMTTNDTGSGCHYSVILEPRVSTFRNISLR